MKNLICLLFCVFTLGFVDAQADTTIYNDVDEEAQYTGGRAEMMKFISANLVYPQITVDDVFHSKLWLRFVVEKDGSITNIKLVRPANSPEFSTEAIRMVQSMPKWIPGKVNGKAVRSYFDLPITICF